MFEFVMAFAALLLLLPLHFLQEYVTEACSDVSCRRWMVNENLQRCLTIEPPEPALKLETLSEIAQVGVQTV